MWRPIVPVSCIRCVALEQRICRVLQLFVQSMRTSSLCRGFVETTMAEVPCRSYKIINFNGKNSAKSLTNIQSNLRHNSFALHHLWSSNTQTVRETRLSLNSYFRRLHGRQKNISEKFGACARRQIQTSSPQERIFLKPIFLKFC